MSFAAVAGAVAGPLIGGLLGGGDSGGGQVAQQAEFKPWNVTTGLGSASFKDGTATSTLDPRLAAFRDQYYGAAQGAMPSEQQLAYANQVGQYGQDLFTQSSGLDVNQMTTDYYNQQQALLDPMRRQQQSSLADTLFSQGRTGAAVGMGQGYVNPEQYAMLQAQNQQNSQLLMGAEDRARGIRQQGIDAGLNYYNQGQALRTQPYQTAYGLLGYGTQLEGLAQDALATGSNIGTMSAQAGANAGRLQLQGQEQNAINNAYRQSQINSGVGAFGKAGGWDALSTGWDKMWGQGRDSSGQSYNMLPDTSSNYWSAS